MAKTGKKTVRKTYLLDSNVLMSSPYALFAFDEHNILLTDVTIEELDNHKNDYGERGANTREAINLLEELRQQGSLLKGVSLPMGGGTIRVEMDHYAIDMPDGWNMNKPDNRILKICKGLNMEKKRVTLVTNDTNMRLKADLLGLSAEEYRTDRIKRTEEIYTGRAELLVKPGYIGKFCKKGKLDLSWLYQDPSGKQEQPELVVNTFVLLRDSSNLNATALGRFDGTDIVALRYANASPYGVRPRNVGQIFLQEAMLAPVEEIPLVVVKGDAGSSKTFYSLACGLEKIIEQQEYRRILLSRPNIKFDEDIGYLKGSEEEKIAPLLRPFMDNLELLTKIHGGGTYMDELFDRGYIEAQALAYMRGRSITDTWIILDEFQNASPLQAFGMVSRAGTGSKMIVLGDPAQIDHPRLDSRTNGLVYTGQKMKGSSLCAQITMSDTECVRSLLAMEAIARMTPKAYRRPAG